MLLHRTRNGVLLALLAGCVSYKPMPLLPNHILEVESERRESEPVLFLDDAKKRLHEHNPAVREARAAYDVSQSVARVKTPLPNPRIDVFPTYLDAIGVTKNGVDALLGWSIPIGGRLKHQNSLNRFVAEQAFVHVAATEREQYLDLRQAYAALAQAERQLEAQERIERAVQAILEQTRRLEQAGEASALDLREIELEVHRSALLVAGARVVVAEARAKVAALTGLDMAAFQTAVRPQLPAEVPEREALEEVLLRDHPELARRRAAYDSAEKRLQLEISKQYPDLDIGLLYERDGGLNKYGIGIGLQIPVFDRNQVEIARADAERDEVRIRFEARVALALAEIQAARRKLERRRAKLAVANDRVRPAAQEALKMAKRAREAGGATALRYLTAIRVAREVAVDVLEIEREVYDAWAELERAIGAPLLQFVKVEEAPRKTEKTEETK